MILHDDKSPQALWVSPLDVRFSQNVIYPRFTDGRSVDDAAKAIRAVGGVDGTADAEVTLEPPFPAVEVVRWVPKLRDGEGNPVDDGTGKHKKAEEGLFAVDNRRLYALQRAAATQWPRRCKVEMQLVVDRAEVLKHVKKFRTRTNGLSITVSEWSGVGRDNAKDFSVLRVWDWRSAISSAQSGGASGSTASTDTGSCGSWEYLDNQDTRRGPFSNWQMRQWWEHKLLPPDLRVRPYDAVAAVQGAARTSEVASFRCVSEVFADAPAPFAAGWSPRATCADAQADWHKCEECGRDRVEGWSAHGKWYCTICWKRWGKKEGEQ